MKLTTVILFVALYAGAPPCHASADPNKQAITSRSTAQVATPRKASVIDTHSSAYATTLRSGEFNAWVIEQARMADQASQAPTVLEKALRTRLDNDREVSDSAIFNVVLAWVVYESPGYNIPGKRDSTGHLFPRTLKLIDDLVPLMQDRLPLLEKLHKEKAELLIIDDRDGEAADELDKTIVLSTKLGASEELHRLYALDRLGHLMASKNEKKDQKRAEAAFLEALSFEYWMLPLQESQTAREYYISSAQGLIGCRQFDLEGLRNTFFLEPTRDELDPRRDLAIHRLEAAGKGSIPKRPP